MSVDGGAARLRGKTDEPGWKVDPDSARPWGYGEDLVYKIEGGKRIPRPEYLDRADEVLKANGLLSAMKKDVRKVCYPKKVRDLAKLEAQAVEIGVYECTIIAGLLQTQEHARAVIGAAQPPYSPDGVERMVAARVSCSTARSGPRLSHRERRWPSSRTCWERNDQQGTRRKRM